MSDFDKWAIGLKIIIASIITIGASGMVFAMSIYLVIGMPMELIFDSKIDDYIYPQSLFYIGCFIFGPYITYSLIVIMLEKFAKGRDNS